MPEDFPPGFDASLVARRLTSWPEYQTIFGSFLPNGHLPYAVRGFFETGGDTCYVVRVAATRPETPLDRQATAASYPLPSGPFRPAGVLAGQPGGAYSVKITLTPPLTPRDLVGASIAAARAGLRQTRIVVGVLANGEFLLSAPLDARFASGDAVEWTPAAATVSARSRGAWGNRLRLQVTQLDSGSPGEFALTVELIPAGGGLAVEREFYRRLVVDPAKANDVAAVLAAKSNLITWSGVQKPAFGALGDRVLQLGGGRDGAADVKLPDYTGGPSDRRGLKLLEEINEIGILAIPDTVLTVAPPPKPRPVAPDPCSPPPASPPPDLPPDPTGTPATLTSADRETLQMLMIEQCERLNFRVAIIDPPEKIDPVQMSAWPTQSRLANQSAKFAALYYPWLKVSDPLAPPNGLRETPPSGFVAGAYAKTDRSSGVWKPPANVVLPSVADVATPLSDDQQGPLNDANVNAIRAFHGRGVVVWGARSLSSDGAWRYIHIRRLISAIEETILLSSRWAVFEGNTPALRNALAHSLRVLLERIWQAGGLKGATPSQGFYVRCDHVNNPQRVIDAGQVVCEIGVAVAAPMEFLVFQIRQDVSGGAVVEG